VLASLASWNPEEQDLHDWLTAELTVDHPAPVASQRRRVQETAPGFRRYWRLA
jgi:hypothetical protein